MNIHQILFTQYDFNSVRFVINAFVFAVTKRSADDVYTSIPPELQLSTVDQGSPKRKEFFLSLINFMHARGSVSYRRLRCRMHVQCLCFVATVIIVLSS